MQKKPDMRQEEFVKAKFSLKESKDLTLLMTKVYPLSKFLARQKNKLTNKAKRTVSKSTLEILTVNLFSFF